MDKYIKMMHTAWNSSGKCKSKSLSPDRGPSKGKAKAAVKRTTRGSKGKDKAPASPDTKEAHIKNFLRQVKQLEAEWKREKNMKWRRPW